MYVCMLASWDVAVANAFLLSTLSRLSKRSERGKGKGKTTTAREMRSGNLFELLSC